MNKILTLRVGIPGARLYDGAGGFVAELPEPGALGAFLPSKALVQLVMDHPQLSFQCQEAPRLSPKECREVHGRLAGLQVDHAGAQALDVDPQAQGGHVLWMVSQPRRAMEPWLEALADAGARPVFAMPWQRAFLAALPDMRPGNLYLLLEPGAGRLLFFQGRALRFLRAFPLPEPLEAGALAEELPRLPQFIQQKHRGAVLRTLCVLGLPGALRPAMDGVGQAAGLGVEFLDAAPLDFLLAGAERERTRKGGLDLLPPAIREARSRRIFRAVVRTAAAGLVLLTVATKAFLVHHVANLEKELARAEAARAQRELRYREGEETARLRFPLLRVRWAEEGQVRAAEAVERLGLRLFQAPAGVTLERVEIHQLPGGGFGFILDGSAVTRKDFSMGALATYFNHVAAHPYMVLEPLREVSVVDRADPLGRRAEQALTRFRMEGAVP